VEARSVRQLEWQAGRIEDCVYAGFLKDLAEVWASHGKQTMISTARTNPAVFFATCARLISNDVRVTVEQRYPAI
jgi:hypothetical protein